MIYFTSDNHFYHKNVIGFCKRPYKNVEEMHKGMIKKWNGTVKPDDTIIIVGDFCFANAKQRREICDQLNGKKILVQGNHDKIKGSDGFIMTVSELTLRIAGYSVTVKHYPLKWGGFRRFWSDLTGKYKPRYLDRYPLDKGQYHIHGHTHSAEKYNENQIHVGVDAWDMMPVSIKQISAYIQKREGGKLK
jgi:calcineurin-like phosphoesterase family protein